MKCFISNKNMSRVLFDDGSVTFQCHNIMECPSEIKADSNGKVSSYFMYYKYHETYGIIYSIGNFGTLLMPNSNDKTLLLLDSKIIYTDDFITADINDIEDKLLKVINRITNLLAFS